MALPFVQMKFMLQTVQMSKRALLAGLASMAVLPLQATQARALGDIKTVRTIASITMPAVQNAGYFHCEVFCTHSMSCAGVCGWCHR